jgi:hypothetical protein
MVMLDALMNQMGDTDEALLKKPTATAVGVPGLTPSAEPQGFAPGVPDPNGPVAPPVAPPSFRSQMDGVDFTKFDNPEHETPKYQIARVQEKYDPTKGVTPEMVAELNALGLGKFRGEKDWLYVDDGVGEFNNVKGSDIIKDEGVNGRWQGWGGNFGVPAEQIARDGGGQQPRMSAMPMGGQLADQLGGDPMARIQQAIAQLTGSGNKNIDALLAQMQGV